jgi:Flp pilus assembly protein TadG
MMPKGVSTDLRDSRGQTLAEFAMILPVFLLVLVGLFDAGRLVFAYHTANNAAREGGRQAIVDQTLGHVQARATEPRRCRRRLSGAEHP